MSNALNSRATSTKSLKWKLIVTLLSIIYLILAYVTTGIRNDHLLLIVIVNGAYFTSDLTRRFITGFSIFVIYWIIFDSMKLWPNWSFANVDILPLYKLEKSWFGIMHEGSLLTPNEYFKLHQTIFLDLISSAFYLCWVPLPLIFSFYLYNKRKDLFIRFSLAFFFVNILGFIIYYTHPAAPPWYYEEFGNKLNTATRSNAAGLLRFDHYFGINLFADLYSKGSNVFAAMPSLHSAYPLIGFIYASRLSKKYFMYIFGIVSAGIWFSAIYLYHHYALDIIVGILCAVIGVFILEKFILSTKACKKWLQYFEAAITPVSNRV